MCLGLQIPPSITWLIIARACSAAEAALPPALLRALSCLLKFASSQKDNAMPPPLPPTPEGGYL